MYKFLIKNIENNATKIIKGNSVDDALAKNNIDITKWTFLTMIR